ncbi:MAG: amidase [Thermodesulfobacteriota bacterium]|jgi:aspartyl-tRNA(Asn)/glutamyl-tRNA(Gln) amidotransferase subunit A
MNHEDLCFAPAVEIAALIREKKVSPVDVTEAFLARIDKINPQLNAYVTLTPDLAREAARGAEAAVMAGVSLGPLHGVPFSVKDLVFTAGVRTTAGSQVFRDFIPEADSVVVARLKAAGGIMLGKTNTPEFGYKATTENLVFGDTRSPWALEKTPGGSSGGAGAATAAGLAPLSVGTDGGGSIRIPASFCGIYGLKPTFGRVPSLPGFGGWHSLSHTGPMTRTVADAALMMDVIALPDERDRLCIPTAPQSFSQALQNVPRKVRVGWTRDLGYAAVDPQVVRAVEQAIPAFREIGWDVEEAHPGFSDPVEIFNTTVRAENYVVAGDLLARHADLLDPGMRAFAQLGAGITALDYLRANQERAQLCVRLATFFDTYDLLVTPTVAVPPFPINTRPKEIAGRKVHVIGWIAFTYPFNLTGNPAASVPCGWTDDGLPIGLQIVGRRFDDALVLQASAAFEQVRPWRQRRPPIA